MYRLTDAQLQALCSLDSCTVAAAIAGMKIRLRNQGYLKGSVRCMAERPGPMVGYAVTGRIRSSEPPIVGSRFVEREDWFQYILSTPEPRIAVLQDVDGSPGAGAFWDEIHARIHLRLGCIGAITNGAVRELAGIRQTGFYLFSGSLSVAQAYSHIIDMGQPVEIGGLAIHPGDLIHGDLNGLVSIPGQIATRLPQAAARIFEIRNRVVELCSLPEFSLVSVLSLLKDLE
jgi:4-hydroxy-4-methyl-2-oxoglutarate aldolase